jgi:DAK2 domain fusion protein YloV
MKARQLLMAEQPSSQPHTTCDGHTLQQLAQAGRDWLDHHHAVVNQLNVFPVPDGDTGTNMLMTMRNAVKEAIPINSGHFGEVAASLAHGAMMGSRGNSGTILSQLWQGFAHAVKDHPTLTAELFVKALREATDTAYRGVIKPVEGTILTVAREAAEEAEAAFADTQDMIVILDRVVARAKDALARTPDMLPILQKAGVVDSGGSGLTYILEGMQRYVRGEMIEFQPEDVTTDSARAVRTRAVELARLEDFVHVDEFADEMDPTDKFGFGYDVQFLVQGENLSVDTIRAAIDRMGWSTVVFGDEALVKVHVHVHDPGIPLSYGAGLGYLTDVVVENLHAQYLEYLRDQGKEIDAPPAPVPDFAPPELEEDDIGVVSVASGNGLARIFRQLGTAELVMGGQTNNPSTQEILDAIRRVPTRNVILLPNNKNIILAAEQAARLATDRTVIVIPTRSMPQGISALLPYDPKGDLEEISDAMRQAKDDVITGEITTATRSVELNGVNVSEGQVIGLVDGTLAASGDSINQVLQNVLEQMCADECELITLYYGNGIQESEAAAMLQALREIYVDQEFELVYGGQPHYHYILSAE